MPTYQATAKGYANLWTKASLSKGSEANAVAKKIIGLKSRYEPVAETIGQPNIWPLIGAIHYREADLRFAGVLHNGENIIGTGRKTSLVPSKRGPFSTWEEAAIDALQIKGWQSIDDWVLHRWLYESERYNGWGYTGKGINSPYVWAGTTLQQRGLYVADGKFSAGTWDNRLGVAAILKAIFEIDQSFEPGAGESAPPATIDREALVYEISTAVAAILEKYIMSGAAVPESKSWGQSKTIWGIIITAAPTLITQLSPLLGIPIPEDVSTQIVSSVVTLGGAILAAYGRKNATKPLS